jgi:hypothetical protein
MRRASAFDGGETVPKSAVSRLDESRTLEGRVLPRAGCFRLRLSLPTEQCRSAGSGAFFLGSQASRRRDRVASRERGFQGNRGRPPKKRNSDAGCQARLSRARPCLKDSPPAHPVVPQRLHRAQATSQGCRLHATPALPQSHRARVQYLIKLRVPRGLR